MTSHLHPLMIFLFSFFSLGLSVWVGAFYRRSRHASGGAAQESFNLAVGALMTLLALIIGFSFSMALNRYDLRKSYEEAEANAIGTEYLRADLLSPGDAAKVRTLLLSYVDQRILWYTIHDSQRLRQIDGQTAKLQAELWSAILPPSLANQTPVMALVVAGMNDVLNSQGYTQAAWRNRIPLEAWCLMAVIAILANGLLGFSAGKSRTIWVLPLVLSIAFYLMADIDTPRRGMIAVIPQNLQSLSESLRAQ